VIPAILSLLLVLQTPSPAPVPQYVTPGAVSGKLLTIDGAPAVNTRVVAIARPRGNGIPDDSLNYFEIGAPAERTLTDNEGNYRLQELLPGTYYLLAGAQGAGTYYPDSVNLQGAQELNVQSGIEIRGLDFRLKTRLGGKLSGRVKADMATLGSRTATITGGILEELLEVPIRPDGSFEFGHVPPGKYLLSLYPPTPGIASVPVTVGNTDIEAGELVPLPTQKVTGRIVVRNGTIPHGIIGFLTQRTYIGATINPDGTFNAELHAAQHQIDVAGMPVGYSLASVRVGDQIAAEDSLTVGRKDISDVVITLNAPRKLAVIRGKVTGLAPNRYSSTPVELVGPTFNRMLADIEPTGNFEFPAVIPGLYRLTLRGVPELSPVTVIVDGFRTFEVSVNVPSR